MWLVHSDSHHTVALGIRQTCFVGERFDLFRQIIIHYTDDSHSPPEIHFIFSCIPFVSALLKLLVFSLKIFIVFVKETTDLSCDFLQITSAVQKVL